MTIKTKQRTKKQAVKIAKWLGYEWGGKHGIYVWYNTKDDSLRLYFGDDLVSEDEIFQWFESPEGQAALMDKLGELGDVFKFWTTSQGERGCQIGKRHFLAPTRQQALLDAVWEMLKSTGFKGS